MIKVSVMYPGGEGKTFDMAYYRSKHMPMVVELTGPSLKKVEAELGLSGGTPGSAAPYMAIGHAYFDTMEDFVANFVPHIPEFMADIPNYTNTEPVAQISEMMM